MRLLLGDGYSLGHVSEGWKQARVWAPGLPATAPSIGVSCWWDDGTGKGVQDHFMAVAGFFPTEGPWMIAEYLVFTQDEKISARRKNEAFKRSVPVMLAVATSLGKRLMFPNSSSGVAAILRNMGVASSLGLDLLMSEP